MELDIKILDEAVKVANTHALTLPDSPLRTSIEYLAAVGSVIIEEVAEHKLIMLSGNNREAREIMLKSIGEKKDV